MPGIEIGPPDMRCARPDLLCPCFLFSDALKLHRKGDVGRALSPVDRLYVSGAKGRRARRGIDPSELEEWRVPVPI